MKYLKQFGIIMVISFIGEVLNALLTLPIPASIYGLVLMFLALQFHVIAIDSVKETGLFLIEIMPVMFVPAAAGLLESWHVLEPMWVDVITITVVSTVVVMAVTGWVTQKIIRRGKRERRKEHE